MDNLLQQQQASMNRLAQMLQTSDSLFSGTGGGTSLEQQYIEAKADYASAPIRVETARKNYLVGTKGEVYYQQLYEKELEEKAKVAAQKIRGEFQKRMDSIQTDNLYHNSLLVQLKNNKILLAEYQKKRGQLLDRLEAQRNTILTNNRKTYYETQAYDNIHSWNRFWSWLYSLVIIIVVIRLVLTYRHHRYSFFGIFIIAVILLALPRWRFPVARFVVGKIRYFWKVFYPENLYLTLD